MRNVSDDMVLEKKLLDKGFVRLVDMMGDDLRVVQAARVSYGDGSKGPEKDRRLIRFLLREKHTSPFEHVVLTFHVKAPIFVARQWLRHRTASPNEVSARYTVLKHEVYEPEVWRSQSKSNRQASEGEISEEKAALATSSFRGLVDHAFLVYDQLIEVGVARELARTVLPVGVYTEFYWTLNLHNLFKFLGLRDADDAQWEIQQYARAIVGLLEESGRVPWSVEAWREYGGR